LGPSHTFEKAGYPVALFNKEEEEARERERSKPFGGISLFSTTTRRRKRSSSDDCAEKKEEKEEEGFKLFPEGI
jgi:hypothetical protein